MDLKLTEILAIYGASLSTFVFLWNVLRAKRRISVKVTYGIEGEDEDFKSGIYVFIQNPSASVVHVSGMSILRPWRKTSLLSVLWNSLKYRRWFPTYGWVHSSLSLYHVDDGLPVSIEAGHSHRVFIPDPIINEMLQDAVSRKIMASVQDQLWNETCSKVFYVGGLTQKDN